MQNFHSLPPMHSPGPFHSPPPWHSPDPIPSPQHCPAGCPRDWIADNVCDTVCNIPECNYDGGDCKSQGRECAPGCPDHWIADNFCDASCNVPMCDYDGGDCMPQPMHSPGPLFGGLHPSPHGSPHWSPHACGLTGWGRRRMQVGPGRRRMQADAMQADGMQADGMMQADATAASSGEWPGDSKDGSVGGPSPFASPSPLPSDAVLCPDMREGDYCDCSGDCTDKPEFCACEAARACCEAHHMITCRRSPGIRQAPSTRRRPGICTRPPPRRRRSRRRCRQAPTPRASLD